MYCKCTSSVSPVRRMNISEGLIYHSSLLLLARVKLMETGEGQKYHSVTSVQLLLKMYVFAHYICKKCPGLGWKQGGDSL